MALNRRESARDGRHCTSVRCGGAEVEVHDDLLTALDVIGLFRDGSLSVSEKLYRLAPMMFPGFDWEDPPEWAESLPDLIAGQCWELYGIDADGTHTEECAGPRVIDWDYDEQAIRASLLACYGLTVAEVAEKCSYMDACSLVGMADHDSPIGQRLYYRTADEPKRTPHNDDQIRAFRRAREAFALHTGDAYGDMSRQADEAFAAVRRRRQ